MRMLTLKVIGISLQKRGMQNGPQNRPVRAAGAVAVGLHKRSFSGEYISLNTRRCWKGNGNMTDFHSPFS